MLLKILNDWFKRSNKVERLWLLAKIEFKLRYYENKLGLLWALIKPLMDIVIYYVVFQIIMQQNIPAFASYLFIGLILWNFFFNALSPSFPFFFPFSFPLFSLRFDPCQTVRAKIFYPVWSRACDSLALRECTLPPVCESLR